MIFSDNYTVEERYSLVSGKRLSDLSLMPWRYTPLYDDQYKPEMSVGVRNRAGVIFKYKPTFEQTLAIKDEHKLLVSITMVMILKDIKLDSGRRSLRGGWLVVTILTRHTLVWIEIYMMILTRL